MKFRKRLPAVWSKILSVVRYNFLGFFRNPRVILTFLLGIVLSFLLSERAVQVAVRYHTSMQAAEPFIWTFGDGVSILLASLLMILLFSDLPKVSPVTPFYLVRMRRREWMTAQFVYLALASAVYLLFIMLVTGVLCMKYTFPGNLWSESAARLGYSDLGKALGVPVSVRAMESITPYECMLQTAGLMLLYIWTLGFLILMVNLRFGKGRGIFAGVIYSLYGFLLDPDILEKILGLQKGERYKVNLLVGWISPLNHAAYPGHSFGYDALPTVGQSVCLFLVILAVLYWLAFRSLRNYHFVFTGS